ncbi:MAG: ATP-binding protein [Anaerolineae bacterium]
MTDDHVERLERLAEVTRATRSLELEPFLQVIIQAACELSGSEVAAILEFDERGRALRFLAVPPEHQDARRGPPIPLKDSAGAWAIQRGEPLRVPDDRSTSSVVACADLSLTPETHSLLAVPLQVPGRALGVLEVVNTEHAHYTEEDVAILETLAACAALALDRNAMKHRVDASLAELSELDRLKSDFIAITSHELRTPLGVILGNASYLQELAQPELKEPLEAILKNATRLKDIVDSVASMDNHHTGRARVHQEPVPIGKIVAEVAASFASMAAERGIVLEAPIPAEDLLIEADQTKVSIALGNLVKNAISFTNEGGRVRIQTEAMPGYVKVSVIDNGVGIPRRDLPRVFDRFFQVERHLTRRHNGMGLGLSVAKVMVEMHGGRIWADSVEGVGSTFAFLLPVRMENTQPVMF